MLMVKHVYEMLHMSSQLLQYLSLTTAKMPVKRLVHFAGQQFCRGTNKPTFDQRMESSKT